MSETGINTTGTILISGGSIAKRKALINSVKAVRLINESLKYKPDIKYIDALEGKRSIGIDQIKEGIKFISQKPFSKINIKALVINSAELMTTPAQNALLKTLEEPPAFATIILNSKKENDLLPTVVSRCRKINVKDLKQKEIPSDPLLGKILDSSIGERLTIASDLSKDSRGEVTEIMERWILIERERLRKGILTSANNIELLQKVLDDIANTNINMQLALEYLLTKINSNQP